MSRQQRQLVSDRTTAAAAAYACFIGGLVVANGLVALEWPISPWRISGIVLICSLAAAAVYLSQATLPRRMQQAGVSPRHIAAVQAAGPGLAIAVGALGATAAAGAPLLAAVFQWGWLLPLMVGLGLITASRTRRVGHSLHCPRCEYEFGFLDETEAPIRCPECGTGWLGLLVRGRREGSRAMLIVGVLIAACSILSVVAVFTGSSGLARRLPDPVLIAWARATEYTGRHAWEELPRRQLSRNQVLSLAEHVLDKQGRARSKPGYKATNWLESQLGAGILPPELAQRYYKQMFRHSGLALPERIRAGEPFHVGLNGTLARDGLNARCFLYIAGFAVGQAPATAGRSSEGFYPLLADFSRRDGRWPVPEATLTLATPGRRTVRAELWIIVQAGSPARITWNDDHTPTLPPGALYAERVVIEQEVDVAE